MPEHAAPKPEGLLEQVDGSASSPAIPVPRPPTVKAPNPETVLDQIENNAFTTLVAD